MKNHTNEIYREHMLELYKNPENYGELLDFTHEYTENNSLCGDEITMQLIIKNGNVQDVKFHGSGCVLSVVSSSFLTDKLKNMGVGDVKKLTKNDILELLKIKINPARIKCALLPLEATKNSLK